MAVRLKSLFYNYLKSRGLSLTSQRARVAEEVLRGGGHFAAEDLCARLRRGVPRVSRATVYRTLDLLLDCGVVRKLRLEDDRVRFEVAAARGHHDHMFCEVCGQVIEFHSEKIEDLQNAVCRKAGFSPMGHTLVIFGCCDRCGGSRGAERGRTAIHKD